MRGIAVTLAVLGLAVGRTAPAVADVVACGDVVTRSVTLTAPVSGCAGDGIVVAADDVTVDLNGHAISGSGPDGAGAGVDVTGRRGVVVRNGSIDGFHTGIRIADSQAAAVDGVTVRRTTVGIRLTGRSPWVEPSEVRWSSVSDSANGIVVMGTNARLAGNAVHDISEQGDPGQYGLPRGAGALCRDGRATFERNTVQRARYGVYLFFCGADLIANTVSDNRETGIHRTRAGGATERNRVHGNGGHGVVADDSHGEFLDNRINDNGGSGLLIGDQIASHGPFHTVAGNVSNANGGWGIATNLEGVLDGGRNRAHANALGQCAGVSCNERVPGSGD